MLKHKTIITFLLRNGFSIFNSNTAIIAVNKIALISAIQINPFFLFVLYHDTRLLSIEIRIQSHIQKGYSVFLIRLGDENNKISQREISLGSYCMTLKN